MGQTPGRAWRHGDSARKVGFVRGAHLVKGRHVVAVAHARLQRGEGVGSETTMRWNILACAQKEGGGEVGGLLQNGKIRAQVE